MSTEQMTREEAIELVSIEMDYVDAHGGLEVSMPFDAGVDWQKMQPCPSCVRYKELEAENKRLREVVKGVNRCEACGNGQCPRAGENRGEIEPCWTPKEGS